VQSAIEVRALAQQVRSGAVTLQDVSLTIAAGELVAIIGASGSGKTTLLDTMCGLRPPAAGTVALTSRNIGYVPQDDIIHRALPLARTLRYAAALRGVPRTVVDAVLRTLELAGRALVPVGELSGGERKRASIASELLAEFLAATVAIVVRRTTIAGRAAPPPVSAQAGRPQQRRRGASPVRSAPRSR
jgi:ABC-type multidrug transport system ATPase subunit